MKTIKSINVGLELGCYSLHSFSYPNQCNRHFPISKDRRYLNTMIRNIKKGIKK